MWSVRRAIQQCRAVGCCGPLVPPLSVLTRCRRALITQQQQLSRNPWDPSRVPGGSSGGSASAVAAGQCAAALGTDTGGSIRQPAHFCGVVGLKPSYGRVPRHGLIAYASSLDVVGPIASSVEDAALLLNAIAGRDARDSTSAAHAAGAEDFAAGLAPAAALGDRPLAGKRAGVIAATLGAGVAPGVAAAVQRAVAHLQSLGAEVEEVDLPAFDAGLPAYYVLALSEASSNLARYDGVVSFAAAVLKATLLLCFALLCSRSLTLHRRCRTKANC